MVAAEEIVGLVRLEIVLNNNTESMVTELVLTFDD